MSTSFQKISSFFYIKLVFWEDKFIFTFNSLLQKTSFEFYFKFKNIMILELILMFRLFKKYTLLL